MKIVNIIEKTIDLFLTIKDGVHDFIAIKHMSKFPFEKEENVRTFMSISSNIFFSLILGALMTNKIAEPLMREMLHEIEFPIITWGICSLISNQVINEIVKETKGIIEEGVCERK